MSDRKKHPRKSADLDALQSTKNERGKHNGIAGFIEQFHSVNTLHLLAGVCQVLLGTAVALVCILGLVRPIWLSVGLCIVASVTTITGIYFYYSTVSKFEKGTLIRDAMRRIVEDQN